jgi:hypothetical protein
VSPLAVRPPDLLHRHHVGAGQCVHQRRLARAGSAQQRQRPAVGDQGAERVEPGALGHADREDRHPRRQDGHLLGERVRVVGGVGFGEHEYGLSTRLPGERQQAFHPGVVRFRVDRLDHRDRVHVRRQHLAGGVLVGGPADQRGTPRQHTLHSGTTVGPASQHHPVAGAGQPRRVAGRREQHSPAQRGTRDAALVEHGAHAAVGTQHPPGERVRPVLGPICGYEDLVPAQPGQVVLHRSPIVGSGADLRATGRTQDEQHASHPHPRH